MFYCILSFKLFQRKLSGKKPISNGTAEHFLIITVTRHILNNENISINFESPEWN